MLDVALPDLLHIVQEHHEWRDHHQDQQQRSECGEGRPSCSVRNWKVQVPDWLFVFSLSCFCACCFVLLCVKPLLLFHYFIGVNRGFQINKLCDVCFD